MSVDSDNGLPKDADAYVDIETFEQILEMDDDDTRDFSSALVSGFFEQVETTFEEMDAALKQKDLDKLSSLGHFLKGSSATLGIYRVRDSCEKIQHLGGRKDETGSKDIKEEQALTSIAEILPLLKDDYADAEAWLMKFFNPDANGEEASV
ncbi:hypothetical protein DRE_00021 [Drechslerella stenobrocha 248]|uniref:HPt domain-containing protein n=1 Tax=Drechslerella stenobrocha 248 TaxID=1043628 RepID=W7HX18_9PEZI|nr:hypothetical protein DRE_00021 [Drechslerella stenobrocha 248]